VLEAILALFAVHAQPAPPIVTPEWQPGRVYSAREAVLGAADAAPRSLNGIFVIRVTRTGREGGRVYLNSESDYRDQRNLTISIDAAAVSGLTRLHGVPPEEYFRGRLIAVSGEARRTQIDIFGDGGRRTGLYYFQTHVPVSRAHQIRLFADDSPRITRVR
jgi:hypothetical protein